ncbi:RIO-type serine/threonine-protein kinase Rio1 [Candidatus Lokiarchaeum ossiferum]|uniref:non-specific serine/threonine protein kinase n=1 Tax=Candidatus Lokiarchaeum ossiferum TaxID=2951803 RepID=A0ABY6HS91_9ARCH|nr:RIO-type serine/threonine-protein kinase Rio1 [Candidatus Lokiarchaeum sp. B-35]
MDNEKIQDRMDRKQDKQREKTKRKTEEHSAFGGVFDSYTSINLNKMMAKGIIQEFVGIISAGKEANVYFALGEENIPLAVKIYKIDPQNTKWMKNYIIGDPRFKKIGTSTHKIIYTWCKKELKNLKQMERHGIIVPKPLINRDNLLVMEFIGESNGSPAPRLKDVNHLEDPKKTLDFVINQIKKMYIEAHLVHGDLSAFNILYFKGEPIIIDVSQAVSVYHYNAPVFLKRDIINVLKYFEQFVSKSDLPDVNTLVQEILSES